MSQLSADPATGDLLVYRLNNQFSLVLNYEAAGKFENLKVVARNTYAQTIHNQGIKFEKEPSPGPIPPEPNTLKWYFIVIIVAGVLLLAGTAYGIFQYLKKKRA